MEFGPPRGMRDFYPDELGKRNALFSIWRRAARLHGFEEYDTPVVETEELLIRKSGEEIVRQIYCFKDKSGRRLALRPEMTPSLARMVLAKQSSLSFPLKWFSIPQCFRYERMTKGRKREHYQWNLDIIGEEGVYAEAEQKGYVDIIEEASGRVIRDTCMVVAPIKKMGWREVETNSFKCAHYLSSMGLSTRLGAVPEMIRDALR